MTIVKNNGALKGIRVLDLGRVLAAPWATQMMGDFGAEIIKVERPNGGDLGRLYGPAFLKDEGGQQTQQSSFFICANRNKKSITVDLTTEEGQEIIKALVLQSDVLVENFIAGTMERFGLGYDVVHAINPKLVYCSVTGYGQDGPLASRPGYDAVFQAHSGMMSITGIPEGEPGAGPMKTGPSLMDIMTGYNALVGVLTALLHRDRISGEGQYLDITLLDTAISCQSHVMSNYLLDGNQPVRRGNGGNGGGPAQIFCCSDGDIYISAGNDYNFIDLCEVLNVAELGCDSRFLTLNDRFVNRDVLTSLLEGQTRKWRKSELMSALVSAKVACSVVNNYDEVFDDAQVKHRHIRTKMPHPESSTGSIPIIANPVRMSETPAQYEQHPPMLGEHTDQVLSELLGYDSQTINGLRDRNVI